LLIFFLLLMNVSKTPPCSVMSRVCPQSFSVAFLGLFKIFNFHIFMAAQTVSVWKV
jgi:hypothetical protein